ncbi:leucyl-tRNA synthetase [Acrasis kona]|uniref:leucine--tRNA ligase n=1 Tax=Acrasis kona TaxID=1008807 RepID=A0AAW2ZEY3_9EUKA
MAEKQSAQAAKASAIKKDSKSFERRDNLVNIEKQVQEKWEKEKRYETDAPKDTSKPKFLVTFPFPYMNGKLHLGHAFSLTKAEFQARYQRFQGKEALFPFGFHCTGMPIMAAADKLRREIADYGCPPNLPVRVAKDGEEPPAYQWDILKKMGFTDPEEIKKFTDPVYWLHYFPPRAITDLKAFGVSCDFRRSFITTEVNKYFDSFVRWQFQRLKEADKVKFGERYSIFAPLENQMCADHDRLSGEGVKPKEYTIVKLKVVAPFVEVMKPFEGKNVYFGAATLRPETMYGQTNCWLAPEGEYGAFQINKDDILVLTERAALNLAYQGHSEVRGKINKLATFKGQDLFGTALESPLSINKVIYTLPMLTVSTKKTTGVVTSVPSDSPDDYAALNDLKTKPKLREKFGLKDEWVLGFDPVEIINIPEYGNCVAPVLCEKYKITSQNQAEPLELAKDEAYLKGFNFGTMLQGEFKGTPVKDAKPLIRDLLIKNGQAIPYAEPENVVISRSGETCVVALLDQWFLNYGEESWKKQVEAMINPDRFRYYSKATQKELADTLDWLHEWGCSRSYGLGTRLPWDESVVVESLSDSTIYMAFYTIAHLLQGGVLDGTQQGPANISPEQLTPDAWDHIFFGKSLPSESPVTEQQLAPLRNEFKYWYPVDMRVSGKDLIKNHLTFFLYNHSAIFPEEHWPKSIYCNGWVMVNGEKMSKSRGNFLTLSDVCELYSADATRIALADAGDTHDDANFVELTANSSILKLTTHLSWIKDTLATADQTLRNNADALADKVFESRINKLIQLTHESYDNMLYKNVILHAWYDLQSTLKTYVQSCADSNIGMSKPLVDLFIRVQTIIMAPITPHTSEYVWSTLLNQSGSVLDAEWPKAGAVDKILLDQQDYLEGSYHSFRAQYAKDKKKLKNAKPTRALIYVADRYNEWQIKTLEIMAKMYDANQDNLKDNNAVAKEISKVFTDKKQVGMAMSFAAWKIQQIPKGGRDSLNLVPLFNEMELLKGNMDALREVTGTENVEVYSAVDADTPDPAKKKVQALPGNPVVVYLVE